MEATDEAHARDENAMTIKWVEEALRLLGQREKVVLEKKKVKLEEKERPAGDKPLSIDQVITKSIANIDVNGDSRRREKGPTIRASYELAAQAVDTGIIPPEPMTEVYKNEYSDFLKSVDCDEGPVEAVFCSLLDDPDINKRLSDDLNAKRRLPKYTGILAARERLPAFKMRDTVVAGIAAHRVTVISGDTGCGKTTQVPQMVLDDFVDRGKGSICNIIVTQPRYV